MWLRCVTISVLVFVGGAWASNGTCADIDTSACQLIASQRPDLCADALLASRACAKYCNLCPALCYHCDTSVTDYHTCNTTKLCASGETCMRKTLSSSADGHTEYMLTCESKQFCDGNGLTVAFGKRHVDVRDVSIHCCSDDLCNYPEPTPPGCKKDVIVLVEDLHGYWATIEGFLEGLLSGVQVGQNAVLMSLAKISTITSAIWDLGAYSDKPSLISALKGVTTFGQNDCDKSLHCNIDTTNVAAFIANHAISAGSGNRPDAADVIILLVEDNIHSKSGTESSHYASAIKHDTANIITIGIGRHSDPGKFDFLKTDRGHEFKVRDLSELSSISSSVASLICP